MKTNYLAIALLSFSLIHLTAFGESYEESETFNNEDYTLSESTNEVNLSLNTLDEFPLSILSEEEVIGLKFLREEEKLARDVYLTLYDEWALIPFKNISKSEQVHMDAILNLLNKYDLDDPVGGNDVGVFTDQNLQKLYDTLIEQGSISEVEALKVGALIEEVDISDIQKLLDETVNSEDIKFVLTNLKRASGFHLRAFVGNLEWRDVQYEPEVLDITVFNEILEK